jgi:proline iminopeptidase
MVLLSKLNLITQMGNLKFAEGRHEIPNGDGGILEYFVHGPSGPLFFIIPPAWGTTCQPYQTGFLRLHSDFTVIYLNPRGSGGSSRPRDESQMTSWNVTDDIELLCTHLEILQIPFMMGHSHGAELCLYYAIRFPDKVNKIILVAPVVEGVNRRPAMEQVRKSRCDDARFTSAFDAMYSSESHNTNQEFGRQLQNILPAYFYTPEQYAAEFASVLPQEVEVWNARVLKPHTPDPSMIGQLGTIKATVWAVFGEVDPVCPSMQGEAMQKEIGKEGGNGSYEETVYDECGHFPWIEKKEQFWEDLRRFVDEE